MIRLPEDCFWHPLGQIAELFSKMCMRVGKFGLARRRTCFAMNAKWTWLCYIVFCFGLMLLTIVVEVERS